jgi:hypothetical protein
MWRIAPTRGRLLVALLAAAATAMVLAPSALAAASVTVTDCQEIVPGEFAVTFSGSGWAPAEVVTASDDGNPAGGTVADASGNFSNMIVGVIGMPSTITFVGNLGNEARYEFTTCEAGEGPEAPELKEECKKGGFLIFTDLGFKNQGQCVKFVNHLG